MIRNKGLTVLEILGGFFLIFVSSACVSILLELWAWHNLSDQLGISPTMASLDQYVRDTVSIGMSYTEVHEIFDSIARDTYYSLSSGRYEQCETVYLFIGPLPLLEPGYDICYNDNKLETLSTVY
jgi:hypothetical protein